VLELFPLFILSHGRSFSRYQSQFNLNNKYHKNKLE
jgi:hypothetical protein